MRCPVCYTSSLLYSLAVALFLAACTADDNSTNTITLQSSSSIELPAVVGQEESISFETSAYWTATCSADWLAFSPHQGEKGSNSITLTTTTPNRTKAMRSAQLTITSGFNRKSVTIVQSGEYAMFDSNTHTIGSEGGTLSLSVTSNINSNELQIGYGGESWIGFAQNANTRSDWQGSITVSAEPNISASARTAAFVLMTAGGSDDDWLVYDTTYVCQLGVADDYISTDYSADGNVSILQRASSGKGIPIVLMGDGFADRDIADGTYETVMTKTIENLFSEEPIKSLRDYFDVYCVTAVSRNGCVGNNYATAFSCVPSISSTDIECNDESVMEYVSKVEKINENISLEEVLAVVILNAESYNGVTYLYYDNNNQPAQFAIALCPMINGLESEDFRQVLTHEAIGHGLSKLADEYGYASNGHIPDAEAESLTKIHRANWMMNVDVNSTPEHVAWNPFIGDNRFSNEAIGIYEGGYTYIAGIYRPTEESMMRSNHSPFNAPSRKIIYDRVMLLGEGCETSTHETFATFDEQHKPTQWNYATTRSQQSPAQRRFAPPRIKQKLASGQASYTITTPYK